MESGGFWLHYSTRLRHATVGVTARWFDVYNSVVTAIRRVVPGAASVINERHTALHAWPRWATWAAIFLVALALRAYRLTGWVLNYDESHWLLYILRPELLLKTEGSSYARPDCLFVWLGAVSTHLLGPNELALRLWPVVFGALSVFPLGRFVSVWTKSDTAGKWAAALLAVSPLNVCLGAQAVPDTLAIFFVLCGLVGFARMVQTPPRPIHFLTLGLGMSLAILTKATLLYLWLLLALAGWMFLPGRRDRSRYYISLLAALAPFGAMLALIKWHGSPLTFFEQPTIRAEFRIETARILQQFNLFIRLFIVNLLPMAAGVWVAWRRDRKWLVWLANLALITVTPAFRVLARELLYVIPAVGLFSGLAVEALPTGRTRPLVLGCLMTVSLALDFWGVPIAAAGAVLERPNHGRARPSQRLAVPRSGELAVGSHVSRRRDSDHGPRFHRSRGHSTSRRRCHDVRRRQELGTLARSGQQNQIRGLRGQSSALRAATHSLRGDTFHRARRRAVPGLYHL